MEFKVGDRVKYVGKDERYLGLVGEIEYLWKKDKIVGVDVGEELPYEFFIENLEFYDGKPIKTQEQQKIEELEQRIEKLEKCVMGEQNKCEKSENVSNLEKMTPKLGIKDFKDMIRPNKIVLNTNDPLEMIWNSTEEETKPSLLTEDERVILRNMNKDFKWIFRDIFNNLIIQKKKPRRFKDKNNEFVLEGIYVPLYCYKHLFKFIKFEDEPYNIEELLKGESGNE